MQSWPMAVAVTNRDIYVFAREIDVMQRARYAEVDFGMNFCKAAEAMDEPLGSKIRRCAHGQHARTLPLTRRSVPMAIRSNASRTTAK